MSERLWLVIRPPGELAVPECPKGHGPMNLVEILQGERSLGFIWSCVNDDSSKSDYCDECLDCNLLPEPLS